MATSRYGDPYGRPISGQGFGRGNGSTPSGSNTIPFQGSPSNLGGPMPPPRRTNTQPQLVTRTQTVNGTPITVQRMQQTPTGSASMQNGVLFFGNDPVRRLVPSTSPNMRNGVLFFGNQPVRRLIPTVPVRQEEPVEGGSGLIGSLRPRPTTTGTGTGGGNGDEFTFAPNPEDVANEALTRAQVEAAWKNAIAQAAASEAAAQATYDETIRRMNQSRPGQMMDLATLFSGRGLALSGARADATQDFVRQDLERRADLAASRDQQTVNANTIVANLAERFAGQIDDAELQTLLRTIAATAGYTV